MDIPIVLASLRPGEDWGPCAQTDSTYEKLAAKWRGTSPVPTRAEMQAEWVRLEAARVEREANAEPEKRALRELAAAATAANLAYLSLPTPTAAQQRQQLERVTMQLNAIIARLIQVN